ncbi:MAG TPA: ATP-binding protein [Gemmatimonadales bacterium]|nr:ATP-binding protein [Gemmatimonadales bacterium]
MITPLHLDVRQSAAGGETDFELSLAVPSDLEYVGPAVELIAARFRTGILSPRRVRFNLRTALAEALANAIAYGNRHDPGRQVRVWVEASREAVRIHVTDDGDGFDPEGVPNPTLPAYLEREEGRGLFVLRSLVDDVDFNQKGNSICLTLRAG